MLQVASLASASRAAAACFGASISSAGRKGWSFAFTGGGALSTRSIAVCGSSAEAVRIFETRSRMRAAFTSRGAATSRVRT